MTLLLPRRVHLVPPVSYQGSKRRQAPEIVRHMALDPEQEFYDLCCGSGAVSLELISRGHNPAKITMVDAGPWGDVWRLVGAGEFNLQKLVAFASKVPRGCTHDVADFLVHLRDTVPPDSPDAPYAFLLLQAGAFGGKPVGVRDGRWRISSFVRPARVERPMMIPEPGAICFRMEKIVGRCRELHGIRGMAEGILPQPGAVVYIDPPYEGTEKYAYTVDLSRVVSCGAPVFASHARPLSQAFRAVASRVSTSASAVAARDSSEYLSLFNAEWPTPDVEKFANADLFA